MPAASAYRVASAGTWVTFSGDTNGDGGERALRMRPSVIGRIARDPDVRVLVRSHRMSLTLGGEADTAAQSRRAYGAPILFANDRDCVPVPQPPRCNTTACCCIAAALWSLILLKRNNSDSAPVVSSWPATFQSRDREEA